jgi:hypothetical protein
MKEHDIHLEKAAVLPFHDRIGKMCRMDNAFLYFKNNRLEILEDKKAYEVPQEPFHLKMLRLEREAEEEKL